MTESADKRPAQPGKAQTVAKPRGKTRFLISRVALPIVIVLTALAVSRYLTKTGPVARKEPARPVETLVYVETVERGDERVTIKAMGTVVPAREIVLKARVPGQVVQVSDHFIDGGLLHAGEELLRLDPVDYEIAITRAQAELARADYELKLESGQQEVARREWEPLDAGKWASDAQRELALREPHRARVQAARKAAQAELQQAQLNLERTVVRAPFNAVIKERNTELGAQVSAQDPLATLVDTDAYWVQASIPMDRLAWLDIPMGEGDAGARAHITVETGGGPAGEYSGKVIRLLSDLEEKGRMARLIIEVRAPLALAQAASPRLPLLLGSYVRVGLEGTVLHDVVRIPRNTLHNNATVWVASANDTLDIRDAKVAWRGPDYVLIESGLQAGDRLVVSDVAAPVQGMKLEVQDRAGRNPVALENRD